MQNKLIFFVFVICAGMQFGVSFGMEEQGQNPAQAQSWSDWMRSSRAGKAWSTAKRSTSRAAEAVKNAPGEWWTKKKKETDIVSPFAKGFQSVGLIRSIGATGLVKTMTGLDEKIITMLVGEMPIFKEMEKSIPSFSASFFVGTFIFGYVAQKTIAYYRAKDLTREQAISQVKDAISFVLSDSIAYPTRSSKINALLKKNEFIGVDVKEVDGIVSQACSDLVEDIRKSSPERSREEQASLQLIKYTEQELRDKEIDQQINQLNAQLLQFFSLDERIQHIKGLPIAQYLGELSTFANLMDALNNPTVRAQMSVMLRLQKQLLFEFANPSLSQSALRDDIAQAYREKLTTQQKYSAPGKVLGGKRTMTSGERANYLQKLKEQRAAQPVVEE